MKKTIAATAVPYEWNGKSLAPESANCTAQLPRELAIARNVRAKVNVQGANAAVLHFTSEENAWYREHLAEKVENEVRSEAACVMCPVCLGTFTSEGFEKHAAACLQKGLGKKRTAKTVIVLLFVLLLSSGAKAENTVGVSGTGNIHSLNWKPR
jgi:hypothetical protein